MINNLAGKKFNSIQIFLEIKRTGNFLVGKQTGIPTDNFPVPVFVANGQLEIRLQRTRTL